MRIAGIMSGTSLDGIDVAIVDVTRKQVSERCWMTTPYPAATRRRILSLGEARRMFLG